MECSAKDNYNVTELFKTLLSLSKLIPNENSIEPNGGPLKRRSSAYVSATSKGRLIKWLMEQTSWIFDVHLIQEGTVFQVHQWEMKNLPSWLQVAMEMKHLVRMQNQNRDRGNQLKSKQYEYPFTHISTHINIIIMFWFPRSFSKPKFKPSLENIC